MQIGQVFKATSVAFKKNSNKIIMFTLSWAVLVSAVFLLFDMLLGFGLVFVALIFFPLLVSIDVIGMKAVDNVVIENGDFYLGLRKYGSSFYLKLRTLFKGLAIGLGTFLIAAFVGAIIAMVIVAVEYPELFQSTTDATTMIDTLGTIPWMETYLDCVTYASFFIAGLVYFLLGQSNALAAYICYQTRFPAETATLLSKKYVDANKKFFLKFNFLFFLILLPLIIIGISLNQVLVLAGLDKMAAYTISFFLSAFLVGLYLFYYRIAYYHIYRHYFKDAIDATFKKHMEKLMGVNKAEEVPVDITIGEDNDDLNPEDFNDKTGE